MPGRGTASGAATRLPQEPQVNTCPAWMDDWCTHIGTFGGWGRMLLRVGMRSWGLLQRQLFTLMPMSTAFTQSSNVAKISNFSEIWLSGSQAESSCRVCCRRVTCLHTCISIDRDPERRPSASGEDRNYHQIQKSPKPYTHDIYCLIDCSGCSTEMRQCRQLAAQGLWFPTLLSEIWATFK